MSNIFKNVRLRMLIFIIFCIGARFALAYLASVVPDEYLPAYSTILSAIGASFIFLYPTGYRKIGTETGGNPIWWTELRPVHGFLYVAAAAVLFNKQRVLGSQLIILDTLIGLVAFLAYHSRQGDF